VTAEDIAQFQEFVRCEVENGTALSLRIRPEYAEHLPSIEDVVWLFCKEVEDDGLHCVEFETPGRTFFPANPHIWTRIQ
jgi:hypothetical protein